MKTLLVNDYIHGSVSNEETLWSQLLDNLDNIEAIALVGFTGNLEKEIEKINPDILIYNSINGPIKVPEKTRKIVLLQDNFIEMDKVLPKSWRQKLKKAITGRSFYSVRIKKQKQAIGSANKIVAVSKSVANSYGVDAEVIPIGTNPELFKSLNQKKLLRERYQIPNNKKVSIFVGSQHPVKGYDLLSKEIAKKKDEVFIVVLKDDIPGKRSQNTKYFSKVSQSKLCELYNCADQYVGFSRAETLWLAPIEAMFCNIPVKVTPVGIFKDWEPKNSNPREEAIKKGLDKETMLSSWRRLIEAV
ncbi:MAG: glycosyltransferase [Candidatus Colwellbacteria bacterium]